MAFLVSHLFPLKLWFFKHFFHVFSMFSPCFSMVFPDCAPWGCPPIPASRPRGSRAGPPAAGSPLGVVPRHRRTWKTRAGWESDGIWWNLSASDGKRLMYILYIVGLHGNIGKPLVLSSKCKGFRTRFPSTGPGTCGLRLTTSGSIQQYSANTDHYKGGILSFYLAPNVLRICFKHQDTSAISVNGGFKSASEFHEATNFPEWTCDRKQPETNQGIRRKPRPKVWP